MAKTHPANHITIFAVYRKFQLLGNFGRYFKIAFPDRLDAEKWVEKNTIDPSEYMVEEMPAIMKAWKMI